MNIEKICYFFMLLSVSVITGCSSDVFSPGSVFSSEPESYYSSREIFITEGDVNRPYTVLGPVEYGVASDIPMFSNPSDLRNEAAENIKQAALHRYGAKVDAVINLQFQESVNQGGFFSPVSVFARGLAIAFKPSAKTYSKAKRKQKSKSFKGGSGKSRTSSNNAHKPTPETETEPDITPSELLK